MLGADQLAFLIADLGGRAVVRLTTGAAGAEGARLQAGAQAETLPLSGTVYERVLRTQEVEVRALDDGARMIAPVTGRGGRDRAARTGPAGVPVPAVVADVAAAARALAYVVIAAHQAWEGAPWWNAWRSPRTRRSGC